MGRRTRAQKETPKEEPQVSLPMRAVELNVRAINLDWLLVQVASDAGMSVEAYTISYDQWVKLVESVDPWVQLERPEAEDEPAESGAANPIPRLVGPTGETLVK